MLVIDLLKFQASKLIIFLIGLVVGILLMAIITRFEQFQTRDIILLSSIIINAVLGFVIVLIVQKKLLDDRAVKNFLIDEVNEISTDYRRFMNRLRKGSQEPEFVIEWFKTVSMRITQLNFFLSTELDIRYPNLSDAHIRIRKIITSSDEFNDCFGKEYKPGPVVWSGSLDEYKSIRHSLLDVIVKINRA